MIVLNDVVKTFHRGEVNEIPALRGIDLAVPVGQFVTVIGSNGAGKSSLLNAVAGAFLPDRGVIRIGERDVTRMPAHRRARFIGRVFQDPLQGTSASLTIEQNLALAASRVSVRGLGFGVTARLRDRFRGELSRLGLGLENRLRDRVGLLSGGQRQALTMAMALSERPEVLLLDEHTAALDPKTALDILELTRSMVRDLGLTTLMVTHNMHQALDMGDRLIMIHRGRVLIDVQGPDKTRLTVADLLAMFCERKGDGLVSDRMLFSG